MHVDRLLQDPRLAGGVRRCHTWPVLQIQTVAEHQWHVARILMCLWPEAPMHVLKEALFHDTGEMVSGDTPSYAKKPAMQGATGIRPAVSTALSNALKCIEHSARLAMCLTWGMPPPAKLTRDETRILKLADNLELWEFGLQELAMGNRFAGPIIEATIGMVREIIVILQVSSDTYLMSIADAAMAYQSRRVKIWS